jgi:hypothetical protein
MSSSDPRVRKIFIDPHLREVLANFAERNGMSESEAIREAMHGFAVTQYEPRERVLEPKSIWIDPEEYKAFTEKARASNMTIRYALEVALGEYL